MTFKDAIKSDVKSVFINTLEFADEHEINGERVDCVIDKDIFNEAQKQAEGVFINAVTIYVSSEELGFRPVEREILVVDDVHYFVRSVSAEEGIFVIVAEVNEQ